MDSTILAEAHAGRGVSSWMATAELGYRLFNFTPGAIIVSSVVTVLAYLVDFYVVPKRFTPGFEHILTKRSLLFVYLILAMSMVLGGVQRIA